MAITMSQLQFRNSAGQILVSGKLNNVFPNVYTNGATSYAAIEVRNLNSTLTLSSVKVWCSLDPKGGAFAVAYDSVSGVTPIGGSWDPIPDVAALTYASPTNMSNGISVGNLTPETKIRLFLRRVLSGSTPVSPESNRVWIGGTSPL